MDINSRFQPVEQAVQAPGVCLFTKSEKGPFIDTGLTLNKFDQLFASSNSARVYISRDVVREMAEQAGLFEELREQFERDIDNARNAGIREGIADGADLVALADRLGGVADRVLVGAVVAAPEAPRRADPTDAGPLVFDVGEPEVLNGRGRKAAQAAGQADRPGRKRRPAGVSADPGDDQYRI